MNIIYASRLVTYKNLAFVLDAISNLDRVGKWPDRANFVIFGSGPEEGNLREKIANLELGKIVSLRGLVTEEVVRSETKSSCMTLAPALTEFSPNYLLRGLSYGKPFLISNENGLGFEIPEEFIFDPKDSQDFQNKLVWILENEKVAGGLVRSLKSTITWPEVVAQNVDIVKTLLNSC